MAGTGRQGLGEEGGSDFRSPSQVDSPRPTPRRQPRSRARASRPGRRQNPHTHHLSATESLASDLPLSVRRPEETWLVCLHASLFLPLLTSVCPPSAATMRAVTSSLCGSTPSVPAFSPSSTCPCQRDTHTSTQAGTPVGHSRFETYTSATPEGRITTLYQNREGGLLHDLPASLPSRAPAPCMRAWP